MFIENVIKYLSILNGLLFINTHINDVTNGVIHFHVYEVIHDIEILLRYKWTDFSIYSYWERGTNITTDTDFFCQIYH